MLSAIGGMLMKAACFLCESVKLTADQSPDLKLQRTSRSRACIEADGWKEEGKILDNDALCM